MDRRYSKEEKGKGEARSYSWTRDKPIRLPDEDDSELIEANKFTLIGRVTNPDVQRTNAIVGFFPQVWHLEGRIVGKELGREKFLFKFQTEEELLGVLAKAPFHFKRWMVVIQRWEPIFSDAFPCYIPFWIKTPSLPVNRWTKASFKAIGDEIGKYLDHDSEEGRVQVQVNAFRPLIMKKTIQASTGREMTLELEYERLDKHCFFCLSLTHEEKFCNTKPQTKEKDTTLGANQRQTLQRIEDHRSRTSYRRNHDQAASYEEHKSRYHPYGRPNMRERDLRGNPSHSQSISHSRVSSYWDKYKEKEGPRWKDYNTQEKNYSSKSLEHRHYTSGQGHTSPAHQDKVESSLSGRTMHHSSPHNNNRLTNMER